MVGRPGLIGPQQGPLGARTPPLGRELLNTGSYQADILHRVRSVRAKKGPFSMSEQNNSIVRRSVRYDVLIRASIAVLSEHGGLVRFGGAAGARDGWVDVDLVDFSSSGLGLMSPVFVPRRTLLNVRLYSFGENPRVILEAPVRVQRVAMTDRRPAYLVGTSFADLPQSSVEQVNQLMELLAGSEQPAGASH